MTVGPFDLPSPNESLQETAQKLTIAFNRMCGEFEENTKELKAQKKYSRHTRFGLWVAIVSLLVDLPLTALLLLSYSNSQDAVRIANASAVTAAHTAQEDLYTNCLKGNTNRQEQQSLFDDILVAVAPTIGPAETTKFASLIKTTFKLRNCDLLNPKHKAPSKSTPVIGNLKAWSPSTVSSLMNQPPGRISSRPQAGPGTFTQTIPSPRP